MMTKHTIASLFAAAGLLLSAPSFAQDAMSEPAEPAVEMAEPEALPPIFTDAEFEQIAEMMTGSWRSSTPVNVQGGGTTDIVMSVAPVRLAGMRNTLYAELARADEPESPYRVAVYQLMRVRGEVRLRTFQFRGTGTDEIIRRFAGSFAFPEPRSFDLGSDGLFATLDITLRPSSDGYAGHTRHPFPTNVNGAVEYKGSIEITPDRFVSAERGYGPDGEVVWGADAGSQDEFVRTEPYASADAHENGLVVIHYQAGEGPSPAEGDYMVVHYVGAVSNGELFQSSIDNHEAYRFQFPGRHIQGWIEGLEGIKEGSVRRLFVPSEIAYGERNFQGTPIRPHSDLVFLIYGIAVEPGSTGG